MESTAPATTMEAATQVASGFTFWTFLLDVFAIFVFILWFWLIITVMLDLFRRHDISGLGKVIWVICLVLVPFVTVLAYLLTQSTGMAQRQNERVGAAQDELRRVIGFSAADEIDKLAKLKASGAITEAEYSRMRAKLVV